MRKYLASFDISKLEGSTGFIGEHVFKLWFDKNFHEEFLTKQKADNDFRGIDFVDSKGLKYQVKATAARTYTFNDTIQYLDHQKADLFVFVQVKDKIAYLEGVYNKDYIMKNAKPSFKNDKTCFVWAKDLLQYELEI